MIVEDDITNQITNEQREKKITKMKRAEQDIRQNRGKETHGIKANAQPISLGSTIEEACTCTGALGSEHSGKAVFWLGILILHTGQDVGSGMNLSIGQKQKSVNKARGF